MKKVLYLLSSIFPVTLTISCTNSSTHTEEKVKKSDIVEITYDFSYQQVTKEELDTQFSSFSKGTLFRIILNNFNFDNQRQKITKIGSLEKNIVWPGSKEKINISQWVENMFKLTPLGSDYE